MADLTPRPARMSGALATLPGLTRVAAGFSVNAVGWGAKTAFRSGARVAKAAVDPVEAADLVRDVLRTAEVVRETTLAVVQGVPVTTAVTTATANASDAWGTATSRPHPRSERGPEITPTSLRERGAALLERSRDVVSPVEGHPAFARMLEELAPDEARVLLLLLRDGPQPTVDVRTGGPMGRMSSQLIAPGLSMIGMRAGVQRTDHVPAYLNNLFRLGIIWFSKEPVADPDEYQVVEAQPDVLAALHSVRFPRVVRRSIHLTPFGEDFCRACLVDEAASASDFPEHEAPGSDES